MSQMLKIYTRRFLRLGIFLAGIVSVFMVYFRVWPEIFAAIAILACGVGFKIAREIF